MVSHPMTEAKCTKNCCEWIWIIILTFSSNPLCRQLQSLPQLWLNISTSYYEWHYCLFLKWNCKRQMSTWTSRNIDFNILMSHKHKHFPCMTEFSCCLQNCQDWTDDLWTFKTKHNFLLSERSLLLDTF